MKNDIQTITAEKLSALTGLSDRRHRQLADAEYFPAPTKGCYQLFETVQGLVRYYREQSRKQGATLRAKQEAKLDKENRLLEIEIAEKESELVPVDEMYRRLSPALIAMRQRILSAGLQPTERDALLTDLGRVLNDALLDKRPATEHAAEAPK